jgi:gluconate 2-dehydrogenase gamma chain
MSHIQEQDESPAMIQRRAVLKRVAWMLGGAVSAPAALAILQGCSAKDAGSTATNWTPKFFKGEQGAVIAEIAEIIIPKTDTSGAKDAGVPAFIDMLMADVYDKAAQDRFNLGFAEFAAAAKATGKSFLDQDSAQRTAFVKQSLEAALAGSRDPKPFILMTRELTLLGFYTSQPGISENFLYEAVPGAYHGCVPVSQMKKPVYWD